MEENVEQPAFVGYYSGAWLWPDDQIGWVKTVLPFFDKVSLILPAELLPRVLDQDPVLAQPLYEMGLLVNREPKDVLDVEASQSIAKAMQEAVFQGRTNSLSPFADTLVGRRRRRGITFEHLGPSPEALEVLSALQERGLAGTVGDDGLFRMEEDLQMLLLAICAQTMCSVDRAGGLDAVPFRPHADRAARNDNPWDPAYALANDVGAVGADLSKLALDEVLDIRKTHGSAYRAYLRNLRAFVRTLPVEDANPRDLHRAYAERREEILDAASDLQRATRISDLKQNLSVGLGWAGAMWTASTGNYIGAALAAAGAAVGLVPSRHPTSAYSYLFRVADRGR
ncbi:MULTISPECIES: hypothetical protein [Pseudarthrobacter]|uniref:hypothetical protein n=1 Tax=Pseudarthrobacter TaxID=1742993 RepID=UPI0013D91423|nr:MULTISPECIES: hypothetical protein [Pseudarthrobacter]MDQ0000099.1 hypothetical protein [Pseudarthrobacter sulfonivorans]